MIKHLLLGGLAVAALVPAIAAAQTDPNAASAPGYGEDSSYTSAQAWAGAPQGVRGREDWLEQRIHNAMADGTMEYYQGRDALKALHDVRRMAAAYRAAGPLDGQQRAEIGARLDDVYGKVFLDVRHHEGGTY